MKAVAVVDSLGATVEVEVPDGGVVTSIPCPKRDGVELTWRRMAGNGVSVGVYIADADRPMSSEACAAVFEAALEVEGSRLVRFGGAP